jgi:hypothetical protein
MVVRFISLPLFLKTYYIEKKYKSSTPHPLPLPLQGRGEGIRILGLKKNVGNKCRRYIMLTKIKGKPLQDYINPAIDFWAKERTLAGKSPM